MKQSSPPLTGDDVRDILDDKLRATGLDQVPKRLDLLDKILVSVDKLVGEVQGYRQEQTLNANKMTTHDELLEKQKTRMDKSDQHLHITTSI